ncbi:TRAP transporter substrate-binding protein, partial [Pseudomonadota bacterium]
MKILTRVAKLVTAGSLVAAIPLALGLNASAEDLPKNMKEVKTAFKLSSDWVEGKLDNYGSAKVTYDGEPITLRMSMHTPGVSGLTKFNAKAVKILEKMSNGKLKVTFRPGGVVHNVREGFDANRTGITDMSPCFVFLNPTNFPLTQGLSLPGLFPNAAVLSTVAENLHSKYFAKEFERQGVYALGYIGSPRFLLFSKAPITKLEDLKGKKVRSGGGINQRIFQALGASTVNMSSRDFQQGLQRGLIDVVFTSDSAGMIFKLTDVATDHTDLSINHTQLDWCMNKRTFDKLPKDLKVVVNNWARAKSQAETQQAFLKVAVIGRSKFK